MTRVASGLISRYETAPAEERIPGLPRHLSPSSASAFEQCARRWKLRYLDRLPDPPGAAALPRGQSRGYPTDCARMTCCLGPSPSAAATA